MKIGVLGTGMVGRAIATALVGAGYEVMMGSRSAGNEAAVAWSSEAGDAGSEGTFADAAAFGELAFNCTAGAGAREAVGSASAELEGKVLIDVSNPLEFPGGSPTLFVGIADSLGEQGVRLHPWPPRHRPPARRSRGPLRASRRRSGRGCSNRGESITTPCSPASPVSQRATLRAKPTFAT